MLASIDISWLFNYYYIVAKLWFCFALYIYWLSFYYKEKLFISWISAIIYFYFLFIYLFIIYFYINGL